MGRNHNQNQGGAGGCAFGAVALVLALVLGAALVAGIMRADPFKTQPSQAAVSVAYAEQSRIAAEAIRASAAASLAHDRKMMEITESFAQTAKDLLIVAMGLAIIVRLAMSGNILLREFSSARLHGHTIKPNRRGQFPIYVDRKHGLMFNPNLQTTPALDMTDPDALPPELQIEAHAWVNRSNIAASLADTKTWPATATQERGMMRQAAWPVLPEPGKPAIIIGGETQPAQVDDGAGIHMHDDPGQPAAQPATNVIRTAHGDIPNDITSEQDFNDFLKRGH